MLRYCLTLADRAKLPTWLISFPGSHNLDLRFGFKDVDHRDINLNPWDKFKYPGFGSTILTPCCDIHILLRLTHDF